MRVPNSDTYLLWRLRRAAVGRDLKSSALCVWLVRTIAWRPTTGCRPRADQWFWHYERRYCDENDEVEWCSGRWRSGDDRRAPAGLRTDSEMDSGALDCDGDERRCDDGDGSDAIRAVAANCSD